MRMVNRVVQLVRQERFRDFVRSKNDIQYSGNIVYDTYMQSYGWMGEKANNTAAGILNGGKENGSL